MQECLEAQQWSRRESWVEPLYTLLAACFHFIWQYMVTLSETMLALWSRTDAPGITGRSCAGRKEETFFSVLYIYMLIGKEMHIPHRISSNPKRLLMWVLSTQRLVINIWHLISQQTQNNIIYTSIPNNKETKFLSTYFLVLPSLN